MLKSNPRDIAKDLGRIIYKLNYEIRSKPSDLLIIQRRVYMNFLRYIYKNFPSLRDYPSPRDILN